MTDKRESNDKASDEQRTMGSTLIMSADAASGEEIVADDRVASVVTIEVEGPGKELRSYTDLDDLRRDVLDGVIDGGCRARRLAPNAAWAPDETVDGEVAGKDGVREEPDWESVGTLTELRSIFTPVLGTALGYIWPGILIGVILKALDTTVMLFTIDETAGMLWLFAIGSIVASARFGWIPIAMYFFFTFKFLGQVPNFFMTAMAVALVGAIFGAPGGMVVGSIAGYFRSRRLAHTLNIEKEGVGSYGLGLIAPAAFLAIAFPLYVFWLTPAILEWLA